MSAFGTKCAITKSLFRFSAPSSEPREKQWFEVLKRRVFEAADASGGRVTALPQTIDFIAGFRAIRGRLLLVTYFGEAK